MSTEADARILIDKLLEKAGWCITNKAQVSTEEAAADEGSRPWETSKAKFKSGTKRVEAAAEDFRTRVRLPPPSNKIK